MLVSIQSQIFTEEPIVNEPGYDDLTAGKRASAEYNAKLRLHMMRHAMAAQLTHPPAGLEDAVAAHFGCARERVLRQCRQWTLEAPAELRGKMEATLAQLHAALPPALYKAVRPAPSSSSGAAVAAAVAAAAAEDDDDDGLYD